MATTRSRSSTPRVSPGKTFWKIGELAELVGVAPHVLRYWETQFPALRPSRTGGGQRHYRQAQLDEAMRIKAMLRDDGLRIAAAQKRRPARDKSASALSGGVGESLRTSLLGALAALEKVLDDDEKDM